jgi:hypothetical protein
MPPRVTYKPRKETFMNRPSFIVLGLLLPLTAACTANAIDVVDNHADGGETSNDGSKSDAGRSTSSPPDASQIKPDAQHPTSSSPDGSSPMTTDATPGPTCVDPVLGEACGSAPPCSQPANPCEAGYIWSCDGTGVWYHELIQCYSDSTDTTTTTAACAADELLFVDDVAGDPCTPPGTGSGSGAGECPAGSYLFQPHCCYRATDARCVKTPAACDGTPSCGCAESACVSGCSTIVVGNSSEVMCGSAVSSVLDCSCGKV